MYTWDETEDTASQKHWSGWSTRRPKKTLKINNYLSAVVFTLSAFVVMTTYTT